MYQGGQVGSPVLGVAEVYRTPANLHAVIRTGEWMISVGAVVGALLIIGTLCWLVRHADRVIRRQAIAIAETERLATAGEMAAAVAHGLRNPLAAIRSSAELGLRLRAPERVMPLLDDIVLQSDRLEHWVRQYLTAAEPGSADQCDDLAAVLAAVRAGVATDLERQGIAWGQEIPAGLPPLALSGALLEQILSGVVANAVQAMPEGGTLRVSARASGGTASLTIADTGSGMTPEQLGRAFEPFVTSKQSGLGLGLALARRILLRHRGSVTLASQPGHGTSVSITVPTAPRS
jgi:signal transduction histidine kinase